MESILVSIIVPVWNTVKHLRSCIESITTQKYQNFEIIIVDDGSTDGSSLLCDDLAKEERRIRVLHQENRGAAAARKKGVSISRGQWVMFVDSDDTITEYGLYWLMEMINDYDIIAGGININGKLFAHETDGIYNSTEYIEALLLNSTTDGPCGKIIRRDLFDHIDWMTPKEVFQNEDMLMLIKLAGQANKIFLISDVIVYNYQLRMGSTSSGRMEEDKWIQLFSLINQSIQIKTSDSLRVQRAFLIYRVKRLYHNILKKGTLVKNHQYISTLKSQDTALMIDENTARMLNTLASTFRQRVVLLKVWASELLLTRQ